VSGLDAESALAAAYALFLLGSALVLDLLARHAGRRSDRYRTAGFRYHEHLDAWECAEGQHLWPVEHDHHLRLVRYRGKPRVCNACPAKGGCTDSETGREVVRFLDTWPRSEAGRFHRAISLSLVVLAGVVTAVALTRNHDATDALVLAAVGALLAGVGLRLTASFRRAA
jgi:hypothetical protein